MQVHIQGHLHQLNKYGLPLKKLSNEGVTYQGFIVPNSKIGTTKIVLEQLEPESKNVVKVFRERERRGPKLTWRGDRRAPRGWAGTTQWQATALTRVRPCGTPLGRSRCHSPSFFEQKFWVIFCGIFLALQFL